MNEEIKCALVLSMTKLKITMFAGYLFLVKE